MLSYNFSKNKPIFSNLIHITTAIGSFLTPIDIHPGALKHYVLSFFLSFFPISTEDPIFFTTPKILFTIIVEKYNQHSFYKKNFIFTTEEKQVPKHALYLGYLWLISMQNKNN